MTEAKGDERGNRISFCKRFRSSEFLYKMQNISLKLHQFDSTYQKHPVVQGLPQVRTSLQNKRFWLSVQSIVGEAGFPITPVPQFFLLIYKLLSR